MKKLWISLLVCWIACLGIGFAKEGFVDTSDLLPLTEAYTLGQKEAQETIEKGKELYLKESKKIQERYAAVSKEIEEGESQPTKKSESKSSNTDDSKLKALKEEKAILENEMASVEEVLSQSLLKAQESLNEAALDGIKELVNICRTFGAERKIDKIYTRAGLFYYDPKSGIVDLTDDVKKILEGNSKQVSAKETKSPSK